MSVTDLRRLILLSAKAHQTLFVDEHPERVTSQHQDIHSQVKLETVDEQGLMQILGGNNVHTSQLLQSLLQS